MGNQKNSTTVYSTEHGRMCPGCGKPASGCSCSRKNKAPRIDGIVRIGRETKGRKGKGVTVVTGVPLDGDGLLEFARQLKQKCGTGGTVKDGVIKIQGDQRELLVDVLTRQGYKVKTIGG
jgi:translation initiation factor 1